MFPGEKKHYIKLELLLKRKGDATCPILRLHA